MFRLIHLILFLSFRRLDTSGGGAGGGAAGSSTSNPIDALIKRWETARAPTIGLDGPSVWSKVGLLRDWCLILGASTSSSSSGGRVHSSTYHRSQAEEEEAADIQRQGESVLLFFTTSLSLPSYLATSLPSPLPASFFP